MVGFVVAEFLLTGASRGPSAIAEPLVSLRYDSLVLFYRITKFKKSDLNDLTEMRLHCNMHHREHHLLDCLQQIQREQINYNGATPLPAYLSQLLLVESS